MPETLPPWFPSERLLSAFLVLLLVLTTAAAQGTAGAPSRLPANPDPTGDVSSVGGLAPGATEVTDTVVPTAPGVPAEAEETAPPEEVAQAESTEPAEEAAAPTATTGEESQTDDNGYVLPKNRILTYYGHPHNDMMGILGEYEVADQRDELRQRLIEQAAEYEAADPSRPVVIGFELIATVAQQEPQIDGSWLLSTDDATIRDYIEYTRENEMVLFLDVQVGRRGVPGEIELIREYLLEPHVHLAIDPEFAMKEGEIPGEHYGSIDATDVAYAQEEMVKVAEEAGIPPKVLLIHQFRWDMLTNKDQIEPVEGVQLIINADGFGDPATKIEAYTVIITEQPIEFHGIKLFYRQDEPLMTAAEIVALDPSPDYIMYQ